MECRHSGLADSLCEYPRVRICENGWALENFCYLCSQIMSIKRFLKDWTLPVAIAVGSVVYLTFYWVPPLDAVGNTLGPIIDTIFPVTVFLTLFSTFCRVDFHQMKPHRWHIGVLLRYMARYRVFP